MQRVLELVPYSFAVWWRHLLVWRRTIWSSLTLQMVNPVLFLFAFGFGLGAVIDTMDGLDYLAFIVPGMMAYSAMFTTSFEATISAYSRMVMIRTWHGVLATPVTLRELLLGEVGWSVAKGLMSALGVVIVALVWGGVGSFVGILLSFLVLALACIAYAACGLAATAYAKNWEFVSYFMTFWVTPNFIFSGVFFSIDRFPPMIEWASWILPTTHVIGIIRPLTAGLPLDPLMTVFSLLYLALLGCLMFGIAHRKLQQRLFD